MAVGTIFKTGDFFRKMADKTLARDVYIISGDEVYSGTLAANVIQSIVVPSNSDVCICSSEGPVYFCIDANPVLPAGNLAKTTTRRLPEILQVSVGDSLRLIADSDTKIIIDFRKMG